MKRRTILAALLCALTLCGAVRAANVGSISLTLRPEDARTVIRVYTVAEWNTQEWQFTQAFENCGYALSDAPGPLAEHLAAYAKAQETPCLEQTVGSDGTVQFPTLDEGLYLVTQPDGLFVPFLVSVPLDGSYTVDATPKMMLTPASPTPTPTPVGPKLPQTGQLWWPVPVLAAAGLVLIALGWRRRT